MSNHITRLHDLDQGPKEDFPKAKTSGLKSDALVDANSEAGWRRASQAERTITTGLRAGGKMSWEAADVSGGKAQRKVWDKAAEMDWGQASGLYRLGKHIGLWP